MDGIILQDNREEWYELLVDDCKAIITEAVFTSRWALVEGYHLLGERIATDSDYIKWEQNKAGAVLQDLAKEFSPHARGGHNVVRLLVLAASNSFFAR